MASARITGPPEGEVSGALITSKGWGALLFELLEFRIPGAESEGQKNLGDQRNSKKRWDLKQDVAAHSLFLK